MRYEIRPGMCDPRVASLSAKTFSLGIGDANSRAAAIYRVSGSSRRPEEVDRLAGRLVDWLNDPNRVDRSPREVPHSSDGSARLHLTAAGKRAGWLAPVRNAHE